MKYSTLFHNKIQDTTWNTQTKIPSKKNILQNVDKYLT